MINLALAITLVLILTIASPPASAMKPISAPGMKSLTGQAGMSDEAQDVVKRTLVYISPITNGRAPNMYSPFNEGSAINMTGYEGAGIIGGTLSSLLQPLTGWTGAIDKNTPFADQLLRLATPHGQTYIESQIKTGVAYKYINTYNPETEEEDLFITHYMTITPGRCFMLSNMLEHNNNALNLGLSSTKIEGITAIIPTFEIHKTSERYDVGLLNAPDACNSDKTYLKFSQGPTTLATLGGVIEVTTRE